MRIGSVATLGSGFRHPGASRIVDVLEHLLSVTMAIALAHHLRVDNVSWAAVASYMVMRGRVSETFWRGTLRVAGTAIGGLAALRLIPLAGGHWGWQALELFGVAGLCLYGAIVGRRSYAWLFVGLTFAMVMFDALEDPGASLETFAINRLAETAIGTFACVVVGVATAATVRRIWPSAIRKPLLHARWHPHAARHALQGATAVAALAILRTIILVPGLAQAPITIMASMLVPAELIGPSGFEPVANRLAHRLVGCLGGAVWAATVLLVSGGSMALLALATAAGVAIGQLVETGTNRYRYAGTQFSVAVLIALVPDSYAAIGVAPAWQRLAGIVTGMAVLVPVLLLWHCVSPIHQRWRERRSLGLNDPSG